MMIPVSLSMKKLFTIIHQFVQEKQQSLQDEFQYKREMLILDATDHQLLQQFFKLANRTNRT